MLEYQTEHGIFCKLQECRILQRYTISKLILSVLQSSGFEGTYFHVNLIGPTTKERKQSIMVLIRTSNSGVL